MSRRQALSGTAINDGTRAFAGALLGVALATAASPLAPFGLARNAEADPGFRIDGPVSLIGVLVTMLAVTGVGVLCTSALLRKHAIMSDPNTETPGRSRVGGALREPLATGWRMAFAGRRTMRSR